MYHLEIAAVYGIVEAERQVTGMAKRIGSVDILKALGICSVILYHTEALPTVVNGWIGSYFMPLFFFASGLTFSANQPKFGAFLKKKCVYLLLPYLLYLVCCAALGVAKQVIRGVAFPVKSFLLGAVSGLPNMNEYTGRAWFIYCFFVAEILFYFLLKWTKGKRTPLFLAALIFLLAGYAYAHFFRDSRRDVLALHRRHGGCVLYGRRVFAARKCVKIKSTRFTIHSSIRWFWVA